MKKKLFILFLIALFAFSGCKKENEISNEFQISNSSAITYISENELTKAKGFASELAVVPANLPNSPASEQVHAECALLVNSTTGEVIFNKNAHTRAYPASTTKCLTAMLAMKYGDINSSRTVGNEVIITEDNVVMCDYRVGDNVPFDVALHGSIMKSGNDAASVLALFGADTLTGFADLMNKEVYSIGATNSHFVNPHGLMDYDHYSTAYDMYLIFREAVKNDYFIDVISKKTYSGSLQRTTVYGSYVIPCNYASTNPFFGGVTTAPEHVKVIGGKSGYTEVARRSYVLLAEANGQQYICVVMKDDNLDYLFADLVYLLNMIPKE